MDWFSGFEPICQTDVPLAELTWYRLGGPARWLLTPRDEEELAAVLRRCHKHGIYCRVLGRGANLLVRDTGFDGAVIVLSHVFWEHVDFEPPLVHARAGVDLPRLVRSTLDRGLLGLEGLAGIPGTVGGATRMNAGGRHGSLADHLRAVRLAQSDGTLVTRPAAELAFGYRASGLGDAVVVQITLELQPGDREPAMERFRAIWNEKYSTQPPVAARSAGCIFKNPPGHAAGRLLDEAGLKGQRHGGAEISSRHANFIIAHPGATSQDVLDLIALAKERVHRATGIELELEVEVW